MFTPILFFFLVWRWANSGQTRQIGNTRNVDLMETHKRTYKKKWPESKHSICSGSVWEKKM